MRQGLGDDAQHVQLEVMSQRRLLNAGPGRHLHALTLTSAVAAGYTEGQRHRQALARPRSLVTAQLRVDRASSAQQPFHHLPTTLGRLFIVRVGRDMLHHD